ncbi:hypothetical protein B0J18DRAFT_437780 [Chaetomium sp. MPI-SDFR-AT-0129]|nr:hypothetical protein B0J18DRAFT_437780 [Chaetomium sp. MPI-SDFR-AT-0129]
MPAVRIAPSLPDFLHCILLVALLALLFDPPESCLPQTRVRRLCPAPRPLQKRPCSRLRLCEARTEKGGKGKRRATSPIWFIEPTDLDDCVYQLFEMILRGEGIVALALMGCGGREC